jgi:TM2 domain-containing membrane protein YozV
MDSYQNSYTSLSGMSPEELHFLQRATAELNENQQKYFYMAYTGKRKSPQDILIFCIIGLFIPGLQRFVVGQLGMGIAYFCTWGLFFIGSILDIVNHQKLALEYNRNMAFESYQIAKMNN